MTTKIEATDAAKVILHRVYPGNQEIPAAQALADVDAVLKLEAALQAAYAEVNELDWQALAAVTLRKLRGS